MPFRQAGVPEIGKLLDSGLITWLVWVWLGIGWCCK